MEFVKMPYLPKKRVKIAVGDICVDGVNVIKPYRAEILPKSMQLHADLTFCFLGNAMAVCAPESYSYYIKEFEKTSLKLIKGSKSLDMHYPHDAAYNVAIVGQKLFCKKDITDPKLLECAEMLGYSIINIKQGYSKCSVCPVDENSAISADMSFIRAADKAGVETLLITNDSVRLDGYSNGFFGGCAYMAAEKTFCTKGDITRHPDYDKIMAFLEKRNISIKPSHGDLYDFGSFIPVFEE